MNSLSADSYFGHDDWRARAPGLKTLEDSFEIRRRILLAFEHAERETDPAKRAAWLSAQIYFQIGFRKRLVVLIDWAWAYWTFERSVRIVIDPVERPRNLEEVR